jgi:hypothetical protein
MGEAWLGVNYLVAVILRRERSEPRRVTVTEAYPSRLGASRAEHLRMTDFVAMDKIGRPG